MRVAVAYEDGNVFQHFGHTQRFKVYDIENKEVIVTTVINTNGSGHGALADILKKCSVDTLICGGIGDGAKRALAEAEITLYGGVLGEADQAVSDLIAKNLKHNPNVQCNHHGDSCKDRDGACGDRHGHKDTH